MLHEIMNSVWQAMAQAYSKTSIPFLIIARLHQLTNIQAVMYWAYQQWRVYHSIYCNIMFYFIDFNFGLLFGKLQWSVSVTHSHAAITQSKNHFFYIYIGLVHRDHIRLTLTTERQMCVQLSSAMISEHNHGLKILKIPFLFQSCLSLMKTRRADCGSVRVEKLKMPFFFLNHTHLHITISIHKNA